jgi:5,10-methylene-tetrahydrofolate dehydrogenase/methenyl tetrahydrofolate cyclohydrolase
MQEREKYIEQNPNLKFTFNKHIGNYYTLRIDKTKQSQMLVEIKNRNFASPTGKFKRKDVRDSTTSLELIKQITYKNNSVNNLINYFNPKGLKNEFDQLH